MNLIQSQHLQFDLLADYAGKPPLFEASALPFWDDPYIAQQMLKAHLDPETDAASRRPEMIDRIVEWIVERTALVPGARILDLGCGPGLYSSRLTSQGFEVTGMDISENSLRYAREHDPHSTYVLGNYLQLDAHERFEAVVLIDGDFCVLKDDDRDTVLENIYRALCRGGWLVFDVTTPSHHDWLVGRPEWSLHPHGGFWKPGSHLVLAQTFDYPEHDTVLKQYLVIEQNGVVNDYRIWTHNYTSETLPSVLQARGFVVEGMYADLTGSAYRADSEWLGIVARKPQ
jgi:SAM-dependent methyltransferase